RDQLNALLATGQRITVTPYDYGVGKIEQTGHYLAPQNAAERLAAKLNDSADPRPALRQPVCRRTAGCCRHPAPVRSGIK
ncbi:hypothetical protein UN63_12325, partial [Oceanisphaera arctica]